MDYWYEIWLHFEDGTSKAHPYLTLTPSMARTVAESEMKMRPNIKRASFKRKRIKK